MSHDPPPPADGLSDLLQRGGVGDLVQPRSRQVGQACGDLAEPHLSPGPGSWISRDIRDGRSGPLIATSNTRIMPLYQA